MRFCSALDVSRHREIFLNLLCVIAVLVAAICSNAQTPTSDPDEDSTDPTQQKDPVRPEDPKKIAKYDVNRIGHRGIGHGFNIYSQKREHQLGQNLAAAFDSSSRIVNDPVLNDYVNRLAQKIVRNSDAEIPFTVRLIDSSEIPRAYGLPGGFLYVDSALIFAAESEAELAGVMAHEIAHVAARHATRALTRKDLFHVTGSLSLLAGPVGIVLQDAGGVAGPLSVKKFQTLAVAPRDVRCASVANARLSAIPLPHGIPTSSRMFERLFVPLSDRYHLVAPDYPGSGHSDRPCMATASS